MKKRIFGLLLVVMMVVVLMPTTAFAVETEAKWAFGTAETAPDDSAYTYSGTLAEAFTAANGNADATNTVTYVKLNKDVSMTHTSEAAFLTLDADKTMVLDLGGYTFKCTSSNDFTNKGIQVNENSSMTVKNGTIDVSSSNSSPTSTKGATGIQNKGNLNVDCDITVSAERGATGIQNEGNLNAVDCTITVSSTDNTSKTCLAVGIYCRSGKAAITNCEITATSVQDKAYGIRTMTTPDLTITNSKITATGGNMGFAFYLADSSERKLTVVGTVEATGSTSAFDFQPTTNEVTVTAGASADAATEKDASVAATYTGYKYVKLVEVHSHCVCGGSIEHTHDATSPTWTAWDGTSDITYTDGVAYIYLSANAERTSALSISTGKTLNLCLNGKKLTNDNGSAIIVDDNATLTLCDCSREGGGTITGKNYGIYNDYGTVTVSGGTITGISAGIRNSNGTVTVSGGTITDTGTSAGSAGITNSSAGKLTVSGTANVSGTQYGIYNDYGTVTVSGGTVSSTGSTSDCSGIFNRNQENTLIVSGGTITGTSLGIKNAGGKMTVSGTANVSGTQYGIYNGGTVTVSGGTITSPKNGITNSSAGKLTVSGGTISSAGSGYYDAGINNSGTLTVSGGTIIGAKYGIYNDNGTVTVDSGAISSAGSGNYDAGIYNYGTANVNGGTVTGTKYGIYHNNNNGGKTLNVKGSPIITGDAAGIYLSYSKITIVGALTYSHENAISVDTNNYGNFITSGWSQYMGEAVIGNYFTSAVNTRTVQLNSSGSELILAEQPTTYPVTLPTAENGTVTVTPTSAANGDTVTITATPAEGYLVDSIKVFKTGDSSTTVAVNDNKFTMPDYAVTVSVTFKILDPKVASVTFDGSTTSYTTIDAAWAAAIACNTTATNKATITLLNSCATADTLTNTEDYIVLDTNGKTLTCNHIETYANGIWNDGGSLAVIGNGKVTGNTAYTTGEGVLGNTKGTLIIDGAWIYNSGNNTSYPVVNKGDFYFYSGKLQSNENTSGADLRALMVRIGGTAYMYSGTLIANTNNGSALLVSTTPPTMGKLVLCYSEQPLTIISNNVDKIFNDLSRIQVSDDIVLDITYGPNADGTGTTTVTNQTEISNEVNASKYLQIKTKRKIAITAEANPANGGTVTGSGSYGPGTTATLTATPATGYSFVNWTENGTEVSTEAEYSFTATEDRALVANFAKTHTHCVCGGTHAAIGTHTTEENPTWVAISSADDFSKNKDSGYYYLTDDIEVSGKWEFTKSRDIVLCLNGYDITYTGSSNVSFIPGSTALNFTLTDCQAEAGSISGFKNTYGGAINVKKTFTMYNGKITGNTASQGGGVYVDQNATFYMYGGKITGNTASTLGGGVFSKGSIEVAGAPVVNNNTNSNTATTYPSSMYKHTKNIYSSTGAVTVGTGGLTTGAQLDITPMFPVSSSEKPAATVTIAKECTSDLSGYFTYTSGFNYTKQYDATAGEVQLVYAPVKYTVTFNMQGHGTQVEEQSVETGTYAIEPSPAPTAQGYTFGGWYTTPECGYWDDFIFDFFKITADTTLYAKWTPNVYTVEFVNDDGTVLQSSEVPYGETPEYTGETPTKAATAQYTYSFNGWDSTITSVTGAKTYTAQFSSTVNKYTVTFVDYDGAELQSGTIPYGSAAVAPADPNREGHTFAGWDKDFSSITGELTVNAQYSVNQYTITFDTDSGSSVAPITQDYNTAVEKPTDPAKTGFDFGGWYADAELTNAYVFGTMPAANITVYAKWNPATGTAYTVKHYHQNTSGSGYTLYESETLRGTTNAETAAEAKNYLGFTAQTFPQTTILPDGTAVVEIKYDRNTYTVTLVTNGGTIRDGDVTEYTYGVGAKLPTNVTRSGYHFGGWYDNEDCKGTPVTQITTTDIGNKTFYAKWKYIYIPIITPTYPPVVDGGNNGNVDVSPRNPKQGGTVTITPNPDAGYEVDEVIVTDKNGNPVTVFDNGDGTYSFKQPNGKVTIKVTFAEIDVTCPGNNTCPMYGYTDLDMTAWYHDGVHFCIANDLMTGTASDTFEPGMTTSRAMIVTILWRLEGKPVVNYAMSFEDVAADTWYTEAIRWAASEDIVNGYSDTAFGPNDNITREQLATILYRYEQKNGGGFKGMWMFRMDYVDLADVSDWAYEAMCWMNMNSIVNGKPDKVLDPKGNATRAEAATMLYRYCGVIGKDDEN